MAVRTSTIVACLFLAATTISAQEFARGTVFHDLNRNAVRDAGEPGLADVCVSNGREVVKSDAEGRWDLPVSDDTAFFVVSRATGAYRLARTRFHSTITCTNRTGLPHSTRLVSLPRDRSRNRSISHCSPGRNRTPSGWSSSETLKRADCVR